MNARHREGLNLEKIRVAVITALATAIVALGVYALPAVSAPQAAAESVRGLTGSCLVDAGSSCTITHGLGVTPTAVTATAGGRGQLVAEDQGARTSNTIRLWFNWRDGSTFPAGTKISYSVVLTYPTVAPTTPPPTTTTPPTTTPPVTTPPVTTPPVTTPPATTPPPTTPTGSVSPAQTCTSPNFTTTSTNNQGDGVTYGKYFVHNNMWNNSNGTYTLKACSADKWFELATQPKPADNGVQTYPNVHQDYSDVALFNADGSAKIRSSRFAAATPATCTGCVYDVAYDIWLGPNFGNELMIWTENKGQTPGGSKIGTVTFGGFTYDVWHETGYTAYVSQVTQKYGTMPLASFFNDMKGRGWLPTATTWQVDFGIEIVSTANVQQRFDFTDFGIDEDY